MIKEVKINSLWDLFKIPKKQPVIINTNFIADTPLNQLNYFCEQFEINYKDLKSKSRKTPLPYLRFVAARYLKRTTGLVLTEIGNYLNLSHSSVSLALKRMDELKQIENPIFYDYIQKSDKL